MLDSGETWPSGVLVSPRLRSTQPLPTGWGTIGERIRRSDAMTALGRLMRRIFGGDRRRRPRLHPERVAISTRQDAIARRLAMHLGTTPDQLLDYHRADGILRRRR